MTRTLLTGIHFGEGPRWHGGRLWARIMTDLAAPRVPDGICLDSDGAIWIANPSAAECVRIAQGGEVLAVVETTQPCFACMLGGEDGRTLFMMTAPTSDDATVAAEKLGRIEVTQVEVPGAGRP